MVCREVVSANGEDSEMGRTFIYSRVSTGNQDATNQTTNLKQQFPHAEVIEETASGGKARPALERLVQELQSGDTLVVAALDRLGRKTSEILLLVEDLEKRGIILRSTHPVKVAEVLRLMVDHRVTDYGFFGWLDEAKVLLPKLMATEAKDTAVKTIHKLGAYGFNQFGDLLKGVDK